MDKQGTGERHSPEVRARAVRMVLEHAGEYGSQWGAISSIAGKIGCSAETLRRWVRQAERDEGSRPGPTSADRARIPELERANREPRPATEILRQASDWFAPSLPIPPFTCTAWRRSWPTGDPHTRL